MPSIYNQSISIFGGSAGIGFAVARLALQEGIRVAIVSSNPNRVAIAVESLKKEIPHGTISGYECNLKTDDVETSLQNVFADVLAANGGNALDHIIFTAGDSLHIKSLGEIDIDFIHEAGKVRFVAPLLIAKLAPHFIKNDYASSFILTTGTVSEKPSPNWSVAASYFGGMQAMTRNLAPDLKPIRVNLVNAGVVDTELWGAERKSIVAHLSKISFVERVATADEIAEAYIYLMKDTNATGSIVSTNGGGLL